MHPRLLSCCRIACALALAAAPAWPQDAWVSPKERPTAVEIGDRGFEPQGNLRLFDVIRVHPSLRQTLTFDDNIYLTARSAESDTLSITSAGLRLDILPSDFEFTAGSRFRWEQFLDHSDESHSDWVTDVRANYLGRVVKIEFREQFEQVEEPINQVIARRLERVVNTLSLAVRAEFARVGLDLEAEDANWDFRKPFHLLDHREDTVAFTARWLVGHERTLFLQYRFGLLDYFQEDRLDYQTHELLAGWRGRLGAKLDGEVAAGWLVQVIDAPACNCGVPPEYNGPTAQAQLTWSPTPRLSTRLRYRTGVQFGQLSAYQRVDRGELTFEWRPEYELVFRVFGYVENNDGPSLPPFLNSAVGTTFDWDMAAWLSVGCGTEYRWRVTDIPDAEYDNFRVWIHFTAYL